MRRLGTVGSYVIRQRSFREMIADDLPMYLATDEGTEEASYESDILDDVVEWAS